MGALLAQIEQDGPAAKAGLLSGDVVIRLDGVGIHGVDDLIRALDRDRIGRTLEMEVLRLGRLRAFDIHPVERKPAGRCSDQFLYEGSVRSSLRSSAGQARSPLRFGSSGRGFTLSKVASSTSCGG